MKNKTNLIKNTTASANNLYTASWSNFNFNLKQDEILSNAIIEKAIKRFFELKVNMIPSNHHVRALFRIMTNESIYKNSWIYAESK